MVSRASRSEVFASYLDYFRSRVLERVEDLPESELRQSRLTSGWTPLELVKHLTFVETRWLEWGFEGLNVADPWGDRRDDRWFVDECETREELLIALNEQGMRTRRIIEGNDLNAFGTPGPRWDGAAPPTLERVLLHLVQEYARHLGHLDVVVELAGGTVGE
ncbi:MAG: mycothiol transferase [Acidimicrobiales bacterium]